MIEEYFNLFSKNKKQQKALFDWLRNIVDPDDLILLKRNGKREGYSFDFPLRPGDKPKKLGSVKGKDFTFFINFSSRPAVINKKQWKLIFHFPELEFWENKKRSSGKQTKPLRWGLEEEDKKIALKIARESVRIFLEEKRTPQISDFNFHITSIFNVRADLDVALWVNGALRGSAVVENTPLNDGIIKAAVYAIRDARFKPLEFDELKDTRIEITLFSDLRIPLSMNLIRKNEIFSDKGYFVRRGVKEGWFLPEVFNVIPFKGLREFLSLLAIQKASFLPEEVFDKYNEFFIFEIDDFIEGEEKEKTSKLIGPLVQNEKLDGDTQNSAMMAADWLLKIQESDGNYIPLIDPLTGKTSQLDWPRSIFAGWSLIEFGKTIGNPKYVDAGRKNFFYGKKYILDEQIIKNSGKECLDLAYLGQEALSLSYLQEARQCGNRILEKEKHLKFEPILFSQIGSFLAEISKTDKNFMEPALRFGIKTQLEFDDALRQKRPMQLAVWAELANLYLKLFEIRGDIFYLQTAQKVIDWMLNYQLDDGSFRSINNINSIFAYTRGTAKIAEVLAEIFVLEKQIVDINKDFKVFLYKDCLNRAFMWLDTMQYSAENSYFIPKKNLDLALGGFRHDYFNQEAWIDSTGHFLLAASRFLKYSDS